MLAEIKCPTCGGDKYKSLGDGTYKCMYCGATFYYEQEEEDDDEEELDSPIEATQQTQVVTRVEYVPLQQPAPNTGSSVGKGMAQGAGAVAGGCLTGTLMAILIPIIGTIIIIAFIGSCV